MLLWSLLLSGTREEDAAPGPSGRCGTTLYQHVCEGTLLLLWPRYRSTCADDIQLYMRCT